MVTRKHAAGTTAKDLPEVRTRTRAEWRAWLADHHARTGSVWLVYPKKGAGTDLTYDAVVEDALSYWWVDSVPRRREDGLAMLRLSPRQRGSAWS